MKRILSFIIAAVTAAAAAAFPAYADAATDELGDYIVGHLNDYHSAQIDIGGYVDKYGWTKDQTINMVTSVYYSHPELFFVKNAFTYSYDSSKIYTVGFEYSIPQASLDAAKKQLDSAAEEAVAGITDDMSDVDKALYVHDYIILNCRYDYSRRKYNAFDCLVSNSCVCQGYTLAYSYILNNYLGIDCTAVYSFTEDHIWNYVKIGNNWYHVDLTLDDVNDTDGSKNYDRYGGIHHDNFLISDKKCRSTSSMHRNWYVAGNFGTASDTSYDSAFWNGVNSALCYVDGNYYYLSDGGKDDDLKHTINIRRYSISDQTSKVVAKLKSCWYCTRPAAGAQSFEYGTRSYLDIYSSVAYRKGKLYFNSNKCVYSLDLSTKTAKKIYTLDKGDDMQIFGMVMVGGKLRLAYRKDLTYRETYMKLVFN
ncbi:MAG: hypothetical protein J6O50_05405 [Ruminiclostridium sp.]|nr:hypothetical protein [Ruminiclostridium sp.]